MAILYNSSYDVTIPFSDVCVQLKLQANVEQTFTVPGSTTMHFSARFGYASDSNVFVRLNGSPTVPTTVDSEQYNEFKPGSDGSQRFVRGGDVLHFITPDTTAYVGVSIRALNSR